MASERQIAANRANAKKSTGPKSGGGKARASGNSRQHGLAARAALNADHLEAAHQLAREIANSLPGQIDLAQALSIADAELELRRARAVSNRLLASLPGDRQLVDERGVPSAVSDEPALAFVQRLKRIERYVRRLQAKRDRLVRGWILEQRIRPVRI